MDFLPVFTKMVELFLIIIIGYVAARVGVMNQTIKASLSKLILYIAMPCTILASVATVDSFPSGSQLARLLIVSFSSYLVLFLLGKLTGIILGLKGRQKGVAEIGIMFSNVGFIGFPVTEAIFGKAALLYTSMFNMPFNLLCYSLGVSMLTHGENNEKKSNGKTPSEIFRELFLTPAMISSICALLIALLKINVPNLLANTFDRVGGITTPGALLIIGSALAGMPVKVMFANL